MKKIILAIFIVTATFLHVLIFDENKIFFAVSVISCLFILFLDSLKSLADTIKIFYTLKKEDKKENKFRRIELEIRIGVFLITTYFFATFVYIITGCG